MKSFTTRRIVKHAPIEMFDLVADVTNYPKFVPLCDGLVIRERREENGIETLVADMTVSFKVYRETFTSKVRLDRDNLLILVNYIDGPFRHMENRWIFKPSGDHHCEIDFHLTYELKSRSLQMVVGAVFDRAFRKFADAFETRADTIYGRRRGRTTETRAQAAFDRVDGLPS